jgi:hypothetical protein
MNSKRMYLAMLAVIGLLLIGMVAGAYGINSLLASRSKKLVGLKAQSQALDQEQISLKSAKKNIQKYAELEKITKSVVPEDKNQAEAVREIVNIAAARDVKLASVTFPASTLGTLPGGGTTGAAAAPTAGNAKKDNLSQLQPVKNITGVYQLVIAVTGDANQPVSYDNFVGFLSDLEHNRRTAQVGGITLQPSTQNRNLLTFSLSLNEYIKP